ncbi:hypothetical protein SAMN05444673_6115 [Bacillus sp. OV166]|nr:DUF5317 domain-containing protein [Bacillus sp. OV166]SMQ84836.1 hypothetical protein SAMN05444673_6115 [Bacillus sp. OV166]
MVFDGIIISFIVGFLRKGNLRALAQLKLKWGWIFPLLLVVELAVFMLQNDYKFLGQVSGYIYIVVYVLGLLFLFMNRNNPGFTLILIGVFLNFLVMVINGGRMPVSLEAAAVLDPEYIEVLKESLYAIAYDANVFYVSWIFGRCYSHHRPLSTNANHQYR